MLRDGRVISFTVYGRAVAKQRARTVRLPNGGVRTYTPQATVKWEHEIRLQALEHRPTDPLDGPIRLGATFYLSKPTSRPKRAVWADRKPDADNLLKAVTDALEGVMWANDSRLVDVHVRKLYGSPPRVEIMIEPIGDSG